MLAGVSLEHVIRIGIVFPELLYDVLANVAVVLFDLASNAQLILRRDVRRLASFTHEVQNELCDVSTGDGNVLDSTTDDIAFRTWDNVRYTITGVDYSSGECPISDLV